MLYKKFEIEKEVEIKVKRKDASRQVKTVIIHQPEMATVSSNICSQMHVQICKAFSSIYTKVNPYFGWHKIKRKYTNQKAGNKSCRYVIVIALCIFTCIWLHKVELTVASSGWWMIAISNCMATSFLPFIVIPTYLLFKFQNFYNIMFIL